VSGKTYRQIASALGVDVHTAFEDCRQAIADIPREAAEAARDFELARLDADLARLDGLLRIVRRSLVAQEPSLEAVDRICRLTETKLHIAAQRAKLIGLNAPEQVEDVTPKNERDSVDALTAMLAGLAVASAPGSSAPGNP
jgi:hypothetical protein